MPYRVRGYPQLETERPQGSAAQLDAGRIDVADLVPGFLARLEGVGEKLGVKLDIFSAYRTDAYSQAVGGFAGDPHTRGVAADINVGGRPIGNVPRARRLLKDAGLISGAQPGFYQGQPDPAHVQLAGPSTSPSESLSRLWTSAGGSPKVANIMAAIALAESGGRTDATHENADGSIDRGLWQINSSHAMYDPSRLLSDPEYNARAAVAVYRSQGLGAWTTYTSGAYRRFLGQGSTVPLPPVRSRPGGEPADGSGDSGANELASFTLPSPKNELPPPFGTWTPWGETKREWNNLHSLFGGAKSTTEAVSKATEGIMWLFSPRHALRAMEIVAGGGLIAMGLWTSVKVFETPRAAQRGTRSIARKVAKASPGARAASVALKGAEGRGRRRGESTGFREGFAQGEMSEQARARDRAEKKESSTALKQRRKGPAAAAGSSRRRGASKQVREQRRRFGLSPSGEGIPF